MEEFRAAREAMVDGQVRPADVTRLPIIEALRAVPREKFVPASRRCVAYAGEDIEIAPGRWLLAARNFAKMLDAAELDAGDAVLVLGSGLGYSAAVLSRICRAVIAIEPDADMRAKAEATLDALGADNVAVMDGDLAEGLPDQGPYDVVLIEGAVEQVPQALQDQLAEGGRLVAIHLRGQTGQARLTLRSGEQFTDRWLFDATATLLPGFSAEPAFSL